MDFPVERRVARQRDVLFDYGPRDAFRAFHHRTERFAIGVAHRRCGKTVASVNDMIRRALRSPKHRYEAAYIAPFLKQGKKAAWEYLKEFSKPAWASKPNESELYVTMVTGAKLQVYGADNADALRGSYLDDAILDEYADMRPSIWGSVIRPMLADRQGTATFIGTPKGRNGFFDLYRQAESDPNWFRFMLPASVTGILPQQELLAARRDMTPEQYEQEFECSFEAAIMGAYYGREMAEAERAGRIRAVAIDPGFPVQTAWDLGKGQNMPVWCFQVVNGEIRVVDFIQDYYFTIEKMAAELKERGYFGTDWVPHDAKAPSLETGRTRIETLVRLGRKPQLVPMHNVIDGINAGRLLFPRVYFDAVKCMDGLEALRQYRADFDEKLNAFKDIPKHDWASHACLVAGSLVLTPAGLIPVENIKSQDYVWTPSGISLVTHAGPVKIATELITIHGSNGDFLTCTPEHKILTSRGFITASELTMLDKVLTGQEWQCRLIAWSSKALGIGFRAAITGETSGGQTARQTFTGLFTRRLMGPYLRGMTFTTSTGMCSTTPHPIFKRCLTANTPDFTQSSALPRGFVNRLLTWPAPALPSGTDQLPGLNGIAKTVSALGPIGLGLRRFASGALSYFARLILRAPNSATRIAELKRYACAEGGQLVYDLTVEKNACYQANGMLVSNSDAFRYLAMAWREQAGADDDKPKPLFKQINELTYDQFMEFSDEKRSDRRV